MGLATGQRIAEVVEAASDAFTGQCYQLYEAPPLGALVRVGAQSPAYAVVCHVSTHSLDPSRRAVARGHDADDEEAVYRENPQLERLLRTEFRALLVGHQAEGGVRYALPPTPPRIHAFVFTCTDEEVRRLTQDLAFLEILAGAADASDDVLASCLRQASQAHLQPDEFLVRAGKALVPLLPGQRLNAVLRRLA